MDRDILKYSLYAGSIYFFSISVAHIIGMKVPGLFIYYNVPSHQYQDSIIAFLTFGWAVFFYIAASNPTNVGASVVSAVAAVLGLVYINLTADFSSLADGVSLTPLWIQTAVIAAYVIWLSVFYVRAFHKNETKNYS